MVRLTLDLRLTLDQNARNYFEAAKKARRKAKGAERAIATSHTQKPVKVATQKAKVKHEWYERFRWCISTAGDLLVGGKDAATNEALIKRHAMPGERVLHTDMAGSPFVLIKAPSPTQATLQEAGEFCATYSRAWKAGYSAIEVFHVAASQVTKEPNAGEYLGKGAFVVRGKTTSFKARINLMVGLDRRGRVMAGPASAVQSNCAKHVSIHPGNGKASDIAKRIQRLLGGGELDAIIAALPAGGCALQELQD